MKSQVPQVNLVNAKNYKGSCGLWKLKALVTEGTHSHSLSVFPELSSQL